MTPQIPLFLSRINLFVIAAAAATLLCSCATTTDKTTSSKVVWAEDIASLPRTLPQYRLKQTSFKPELIADLKRRGGITDAHQIQLEGDVEEPGATAFSNPEANTSVAIYPMSGLLVFDNPNAEGDFTKPPVNVPSEAEARALADKLVLTLGLPLEDLLLRTTGGERYVLYSKQNQQRASKTPLAAPQPEETYGRGVRYFQAFGGPGVIQGERARGIHVQFGTEGKITLLEINWMSADPAGTVKTASRRDIEKRLLANQGTWQKPLPADFTALRITKQSAVYRDPVMLKGLLAPSLILTVKVETVSGSTSNVFTCSPLKGEPQ